VPSHFYGGVGMEIGVAGRQALPRRRGVARDERAEHEAADGGAHRRRDLSA